MAPPNSDDRDTEERLRGTISSFGIGSGHRFVVGAWRQSPIGSFADVMTADPDGRRTLLAPSTEVAEYVSSVYAFDETKIVPFDWQADDRTLTIAAGPLRAAVTASGGFGVPLPRPWWVTRWIERPVARALMGVETWGVSPLGVEEWYQARRWRWIRTATIEIDGVDAGPATEVLPPLGVGFSEPPPRPSIVDVAVRIRRRA